MEFKEFNYVEGAVTIQARMGSSLTSKGEFTAVKRWEESLRIISDSIRYVDFDEATFVVMSLF